MLIILSNDFAYSDIVSILRRQGTTKNIAVEALHTLLPPYAYLAGLAHFVMNALHNRIKKNIKLLKPYVKKHGLTCYRVFDWDMPEYPLCVDIYEDCLHVAEYKTRHALDETAHQLWLHECIQTLQAVFDTPADRIAFKTRERMKTQAQYEKVAETRALKVVQENGLKFYVNLYDYLDTGLFLDHRITRMRVKEEAAGKQVLNLFSYTGSFSVYAAAGGAEQVCTVDLSNTYLRWAEENFRLNQLDPEQHVFIKTDVKEWIKEGTVEKYDLVILDPPTVSRSKMSKSKFDIQPDHPELIHHVMRQMKPGGVLYFSTNFREFRFMPQRIQAQSIEDITASTIPDDFRNKIIHYCWRIVK